MMLESLGSNPVIQTIAGDGPYPYVWELSIFFFLLQVVSDLQAEHHSKSNESQALHAIRVVVRAFAGFYMLIPLLLGNLPSSFIRDFDRYALIYVCVLAFNCVGKKLIPKKVQELLKTPKKISYAVFVSNCCVTATIDAVKLYPASRTAPLLLGFLAVNGGLILESGVSGKSWKSEYSHDQVLSLLGPAFFLLCTGQYVTDFVFPETIARVAVVVLHLSTDYVDYNEILAYFNSIRVQFFDNTIKALRPSKK